MSHIVSRAGIGSGVTAAAMLLLAQSPSSAQRPQTKEGAAIIIEGTVREVFRSPRQSSVDCLVQIEAARSEYGRAPADPRRVQAPAPGDPVYVHVLQPAENQGRSGVGHTAIPAERTRIRAYLYARSQGGWEGAYPDWFEQLDTTVARRGPNDPEPPAGAAPESLPTEPDPGPSPAPASGGSILQRLGLRAEQIQVSGRLVLKVIDVAADSPAGKAGIEPGDAVIGINGGFITDLDQLEAAITKGGRTAVLSVLNVRDGKTASVKVDLSGLSAGAAPRRPTPDPTPGPAPVPTPAPAPAAKVLGVKTEQVRLGLRTTAVRVTQVQEDSPAARAGLEPGDVILSAGGTATSSSEQLTAAVQKSGPVLELKVFDPRTRREVPVQVHFDAAASAPAPAPAPDRPAPDPVPPASPAPGPGSVQAVGLVVEAGTADLLPVVKITRVVPGSPAEKAGLEVGDSIVALNDKVIFAPDLLEEALKSAGNSFTLSVLDVKTGKRTPVSIKLP